MLISRKLYAMYFQQAVGIFGHMTSKNPLDDGPNGDQTRKDQGEDVSATLEKTVDLQSVTNDIEKSLEKLASSVDDTINKSDATAAVKVPEPPHFTVATSPTRRTHKDD